MKLVVFFFLLSVNAFTQTLTGVVFDAKTGEKLPYVNIVLLHKNKGVTTNEKGAYQFNISGETKDTLQISYIGYKTQFIALAPFVEKKKHTLFVKMQEDKGELDPVLLLVKKAKYTVPKILGDNKKKRYASGGPFGYESCVLIKNKNKKIGKVNEVVVFFKKNKNTQFKVYPCLFRVKFYEFDVLKKKPGKLLSYREILIKPENKTQKVIINVASYNILFPVNGICVGIERINNYSVNKPNTIFYTTAPSLTWTHSEEAKTWSRFMNKHWKLKKRKSVLKQKLNTNLFVQLKVQYRK